ncbi:MAG: hypothetical protein ABI639_17470 [Thermoanaerobaculia bacterium]
MTEEQSEEFTLHGPRATFLAIVIAEAMVIGPMIALLPHWMAFWEPRFVGLLMMTMAAPFVMVLPATLRAKIAEAVADTERRRATSLAETAANKDLIPNREERT